MLDCSQNNNNKIIMFNSLNSLFEYNGWKNENENEKLISNNLTYSKPGNEIDVFDFEFKNNNIYVSVPLKNSYVQYKTKFANYSEAIKYTESKFNYFNNIIS